MAFGLDAMLTMPPMLLPRLLAERDRQRARQRLEELEDRMMAGQTDMGTTTEYVGKGPKPVSDWRSDNRALREHQAHLQRQADGLPRLQAPEVRERLELERQAALHRQQLQSRKGLN